MPTSGSRTPCASRSTWTKSSELTRFDRVLANPPFCQNYIKKDIKFPGRFPVWLPEKGKKADLMFVQHMLAMLKADGKLATVMPHGVLFRGGEEREVRQHFIERGCARSGHRPAGRPVLRHRHPGLHPGDEQGRRGRRATMCLFINADREYREGKAQNHLRPEDIEKIVHVYRAGSDVPAYARRVPVSRDRGRGLQLQHPPLRRQRPAARTARRARPPAWRRAGRRDRCAGATSGHNYAGPARELLRAARGNRQGAPMPTSAPR